ncbi:MAG: DUF5063 domain-containing protein [Prolixibacteraceae bacterium]|nr:DUF5063 domain-containing protein [Prolixibacteraceae bacterium]
MTEENFNHIVYSRNVIEFVTVAKEYCTYLESHSAYSRFGFLKKVQLILPLLYVKISLVPEMGEDEFEVPEKFVSEVDYTFLLNKLTSKLGQYDNYQEVFDPGMQFSESALDASISENLCDIYQDLKDFIMAFRIGTLDIMTGALWECCNNFKVYWGQKLVNCLRAVHSVLYDDNYEDDEVPMINDDMSEQANDNWVSKHFNNFTDKEQAFDEDV